MRVGELDREATALKSRIATDDDLVVQLRERNVGFSMRVDYLNTSMATRWAEVELVN